MEPDFVIFDPEKGLLIIEVKDWRIQNIQKISHDHFRVEFGYQTTDQKNPLAQARGYTMALINQLKGDPRMRQPSGKYEGDLAFPYGWGVAFPNITRKQFEAAFPLEERERILPGRRVICRDEMTELAQAEDFRKRIHGMFEYNFEVRMDAPQLDRLRWHLYPEIRIQAIQGDLFDDDPAPDLVKVMDLQQEQLARNLGSGHRVIHGVAGSGKTLILCCRCAQLAPALSKPVLVLCFNVSLAARLRSFFEERGLSDKVHVHHFHEWCGRLLREHQVKLPDGEQPYWERQVSAVLEGVKTGAIPTEQYGAVMIDEGHDFEPEWLKLAVKMADPVSGSFLLLYDDAQSIYRKSNQLGFSLSSVGIKAAGRTSILRLNYRNSQQILRFAYDFAKNSLNPKGADEDHIPLIEPESAGLSGPAPVFKRERSIQHELNAAIRSIREWLGAGIPSQEIAVIYFKGDHGKLMSDRLQREGLSHLLMDGKAAKKEYNPAKARLTVLTAQSSKGLEFQCVVLVGIGFFPANQDQIAEQTRLLYVGMTRAKKHLVMCSSVATPLTERLEALAG